MITPNIPEAEVLTNPKIKNLQDMIIAANILLKLGVKNVLIKGGHKKSKYTEDVFLNKKKLKFLKIKKLKLKIHMELVVLYQALLQLFYHVENL